QVVDGPIAVGDDLHRIRDLQPRERASDQHHVGGIVFHDQNRLTLTHAASARGSSTQKRLPRPSCDSTPTRPPSRSIPFLTIAKPIPVPGYVSVPCRRSKTPKIRS